MAEDIVSATPVLSTSTPDKQTDVSPGDIGTDEANAVHEDAEQVNETNNDAADKDIRNVPDTERDADASDVDDLASDFDSGAASGGRSQWRVNIESDVKFLLGMVSKLERMLEESISVAMPEHLMRASMALSYSIASEIHARLPGPEEKPSRQVRSTHSPQVSSEAQIIRPASTYSEETHIGPDISARLSIISVSDDPEPIPPLDDFVRSCEEQRLIVSHKAVPLSGQINLSGVQRYDNDIIVFWDNVGSDLESNSVSLLPQYFPRRDGESLDILGGTPTLIKIASYKLLDMLSSIMNLELDKVSDGFIAAPFGALVFHSSRIHARIKAYRQSAAEIEEELRSLSRSGSTHSGFDRGISLSAPTVGDGEKQRSATSESDDTEDSFVTRSIRDLSPRQMRLRDKLRSKVHFCLLMEGLEDLLKAFAGPSLEIHDEIENGTLKVISFEELWQLFPPGENVLNHKEGQDVACQVYNISGGRRSNGFPERTIRDFFSAPDDIVSHTKADDSRPRDRGIPTYPSHLIGQLSSQGQTALSSDEKQLPQAHGSFAPLIVNCFMMDFDGTHVGPCHIGFQFDYFPGKRSIRSLGIYPLRFRPDKDKLSATLRERGRRVLSAAGHRTHSGMSFSGFDDIYGQIYLDNAAGYRHIGWPKERLSFGRLVESRIHAEPGSRLPKPPMFPDQAISRHADSLIQNLTNTLLRFVRPETTTLVEDCYLLMSPIVLGYAFQQRRWYYFDIDCVGNIDKSEEARLSGWKDLVIPSKFREMLVALVDSHASGVGRTALRKRRELANQVDLVRGKGNGLIILLHGPPGTGKTSTAETIAAYTQRPLYSITCGDIGTTAEDVEFNLQKHFDLANQWGCVLCLDEADVFLTKRDWHDLNRNSLVSVWLRVLEYYSGILFITTNRIGVIDEAFKSRIHLCLRYPSINIDSTKSIWTKILDRIEAENRVEPVKIEFNRDAIMGFAEKHYQRNEATGSTWNGRQIRNVVQTAISLGQYDRLQRLRRKDMTEDDAERSGKPKYMRVELTRENLKSIAATATEFEHYITNVRGADASVARNESVRDDDYDGSGKKPQKSYNMLEVARAGPVPGMGIGFGAGTVVSGSSSGGWPASQDWGGVSEASHGMAGKGKKKTAVVDDDSDSSA